MPIVMARAHRMDSFLRFLSGQAWTVPRDDERSEECGPAKKIIDSSIALLSLQEALQNLKLVTQTELHLAVGTVGVALPGYFAKGVAGRRGVWVIEVGMVHEIKCLGLEDEAVVFVRWNNRECLLHGDVPTLEAWAVNLIAGLTRREGSGGRSLEDIGREPEIAARIIRRAFLDHLHGAVEGPKLIAGARAYTGEVVASGD